MVNFKLNTSSLHKGLEKLKLLPKQIAALVKEDISRDLDQTFTAGQDPYGVKWKLRKVEPKDGHPLMFDTGELYNSRKVTVQSNGELTVEFKDEKAVHHQYGAPKAHLPRRQLVPTTARGIPKRWRDALIRSFKRSLREIWP